MKGFVYILKDVDEKYYVGSTLDIKRRFRQHISGHTKTTHRMKSPVVVLCQEYISIGEARVVERKIKALKRKDYLDKIVKDGYIKLR